MAGVGQAPWDCEYKKFKFVTTEVATEYINHMENDLILQKYQL